MSLFGKKTSAKANSEDLNLIESNAQSVGVLMSETEDADFRAALKKLQEELKYLMPSVNPRVYDCDKKIRNLLEDLKIALVKCGDEAASEKAHGLLKDLNTAVAERKTVE